MQSPPLSVGNPVQARCTKCRKNTAHLIVTLVEEGPLKVQCNNCSRQHKYRPPIEAKKTTAKQATSNKDAERREWEALRPRMNSAEAAHYSMTDGYKVKALINHPVFGLGIVQRVVGQQKVEILFEDGKKTMRCK